jgi:23S rRNA (cytosine1962-C5)-methyltransferase
VGSPEPGDVVRVLDAKGDFLAWGYFNPASKIHVRVLDWRESARIDSDWWRDRLGRAIGMRRVLPSLGDAEAYRLVYSEADGIPGLIVDRYGEFLVTQLLTAGVERVRPVLLDLLNDIAKPSGIYDRSDVEFRELEGLAAVAGAASGEAPPDWVEIREGRSKFLVDVKRGHKTGFYLDQRENRRAVSSYAPGREVLDLFAYTGAFGVAACGEDARRVTSIESSSDSIEVARRNFQLNGIASDCAEFVHGSAFDVIRTYRDQGRRFGMVVCDPPKFAHTKAQLPKAERAYKDINLLAMKVLEEDGILATFSCSGAVSAEQFSRVIAWAAIDAGRDIQIIQRLSQSADHPINPCFPESEYLKGLVCRVI